MKKSKKYFLQKQKEEEKKKKEIELQKEEHVKRRIKSGYREFTVKALNIIKIVLLVCLPLSYFLYSLLLLPLCLLYSVLFFVTKSLERKINQGLKKDLWTRLFKFDTIFAISAVVISLVTVGISFMTTSQRTSMFAGKNEAQIFLMLQNQGMSDSMAESMARRIVSSGQAMGNSERMFRQAMTLMTGERVLGQTQGSMGLGGRGNFVFVNKTGSGGGGGGILKIRDESGNVTERPAGGNTGYARAAGVARMASPISQVFNQIFSTLIIIFLCLTFVSGVFIVIVTFKKKIE